jgi:hypothetical protein
MVANVWAVWVAAALAQAGAADEAAWLKSVPAEAEVVIRVRGMSADRDDLDKMLRAMSPNLAETVTQAIDGGLQQFAAQFGDPATKTPFLAVMRLPKPDAAGMPPFATIVKSNNYEAVQKALAGGEPKPKSRPGGVDAIEASDGQTFYTTKGSGFVAFGSDEALVAAIAKPAGKGLEASLDKGLRDALLEGDLGLYVNLAAVQSRYGDQIDQLKQTLMAALEQAGNAGGGNAGLMDAAKSMYGRLFDSLKVADGLALNFDFEEKGLTLAGLATVKSGSDAAKRLGSAKSGSPEALGKLPDDAATYGYLNISPESFEGFQRLGMSFLAQSGGKPSPELQKALDQQRAAGVTETLTASGFGGSPARNLTLMKAQNPEQAAEATAAMMKALKSGGGALDFIKDIKVDPGVQTYAGYRLNKATITFDPEKLAKLQPNKGNGASAIRAMFGGDSLSTWFGTDGKQVLSVSAPTWEAAKAQIDALQSGRSGLGERSGYKAVRAMLPERASIFFLMSAQGLARQMATQLSASLPGAADLKVPTDMPKEPALFGMAITSASDGHHFKLAVPSQVGPVFEKGLLPLFQGIAGQVTK